MMLRKSSYYADTPREVRVFLDAHCHALWIKGPLSLVVIRVGRPLCTGVREYAYLDNYVSWARFSGFSSRSSVELKRSNNALVKQIHNAISWACIREERYFKLVGRGYKVLWSKTRRCLHLVLGFSGRRVIPVSPLLNVKLKNRYNFSAVSTDLIVLERFAMVVQGFRPPNIYTGRGILRDGQVIEKRSGKQTQY